MGKVAGMTVSLGTNDDGGTPSGCGRHLRRVVTFDGNGDVAGSHD